MDHIVILPLIKFLQNLSIEITSIILLIICIISILSLFKLFGAQGLYLHSIVAILTANMQVFKIVKFNYYSAPVALGTIVFASTYLCSGILSEHFGATAAKKNIWYSFCAQLLMTIIMLITIGHKPLLINQGIVVEQAMATLFIPLPRILLASLISFILSQYMGILVFNLIKKLGYTQYIWLRTMILLIVSILIDTFTFNLLAWKFLAPNPLSFTTILHTYIICTLITQGFIIILATPITNLSYYFKPKRILS